MPVLPNQRHERFAQELAKNKTSDEAYALAGFKPNRGNASRLKANDSIATRVAELQEKAAESVGITLESLTEELEQARVLAMADEKGASAAVAATMGKAKLHGFLVERSENVNHNYTISDEPAEPDDWADKYAASN